MSRTAPLPSGYAPPPQVVWDKEVDRIDRHCRTFIGMSPWLTLATSGQDGPDVSPRGGQPGFVAVLDEHRLALPDRPGNGRVDSLRNLLENPRVALMFVVPGIEETLRVYGTASVVPDAAELGADLTEFGRAPRSVLLVEVQRAYFQCAKSLMRARLWQPESWPARGDFASIGRVFRDHCDLPAPLPPDDVMRADMEQHL